MLQDIIDDLKESSSTRLRQASLIVTVILSLFIGIALFGPGLSSSC